MVPGKLLNNLILEKVVPFWKTERFEVGKYISLCKNVSLE
jgi:hypothetical protein